MSISLEEQEVINNCMYFKDKYFFFFCEKYCEEFNVAKVSPIFDGRVDQLMVFVNHVMIYRNELFYYPNKNKKVGNVYDAEQYISTTYENKIKNDNIFVPSRSNQIVLDKMTTDFTYFNGIDYTLSGDNAIYPINLSKSGILISLFILLVI